MTEMSLVQTMQKKHIVFNIVSLQNKQAGFGPLDHDRRISTIMGPGHSRVVLLLPECSV